MRALVARIQLHLRRPHEQDTLSYSGLRAVPDKQRVTFEGKALNLTDMECRILALMLRERGGSTMMGLSAAMSWMCTLALNTVRSM
ncbi:hypothetical protein GCM10008957_51790 [Deinococcus ruber]|uniref:Uncharacterized protein n=1 Tax=Deinococcus ruber TaxID=1848197 RepID=A0A918KVD9_9DEIO|nr:hypothetical protein GCM10008957_51790 [Deinococcus ruber]